MLMSPAPSFISHVKLNLSSFVPLVALRKPSIVSPILPLSVEFVVFTYVHFVSVLFAQIHLVFNKILKLIT